MKTRSGRPARKATGTPPERHRNATKTSPQRAAVNQWARDRDLELVLFDPPKHFDAAIVGVIHGFGQEPAVVYDEELVLKAMAKDMGAAKDSVAAYQRLDEAVEWFDFNTIGAYVGEATPRFLIWRPGGKR
jgi:hypothetical protein